MGWLLFLVYTSSEASLAQLLWRVHAHAPSLQLRRLSHEGGPYRDPSELCPFLDLVSPGPALTIDAVPDLLHCLVF